jgi:deoxycytidylate deaminase
MEKKRTGRTFHVTFIASKRKLLQIGINNYKKKAKPSYKKEGEDSYQPCIHSELDALIKIKRDTSNLDFYNIRIDKNGNLAKSEPCINCKHLLNEYGFRKIVYFDGKQFKQIRHI